MRCPFSNSNAEWWKSEAPRRRRRIVEWRLMVNGTTAIINAVLATVTFCYFAFVESGLVHPGYEEHMKTHGLFFVAVLVLVLGGITVIALGVTRSVWQDLLELAEHPGRLNIGSVVGKVMNLPARMAAVSLCGWLIAGAIYSIAPGLLVGTDIMPFPVACRAVLGIVLIGGPFTSVSVYFILEWKLRRALRELFPPESLLSLPNAMRILVLPKMLVVSLMIGIIPVSLVSVLTLTQIHEIYAGHQNIASFLSHMPLVVGFLLFIAVALAVGLSISVARSVSEPLRLMEAAMDRIRDGDLNATIPVLSNDEIGVMAEGFNRMLAGLRERDFIRDTFGTYLSEEVVEEILASPAGVKLGGELREVTILVSDLRGFTSLTAALEPEIVVQILNHYLARMVDIIMNHGGIIDEFTGDGILAFFGAPRKADGSQERAVRAAIDMQEAMPSLNDELHRNIPEARPASDGPVGSLADCDTVAGPVILRMGIGISCGMLVVGSIGSEKRKKYGAVGAPINIAFRVEKETAGDDILITPEVFEEVAHMVKAEAIPHVELKGIDQPITLYKVSRERHEGSSL
jgi:adenylate cyclase